MHVVDLAIERLGTRRDARKIDDGTVRGLIESIREVGIINPLRVRPKRLYVNGVEDDGFEVIAGAHRFRAACLMHRETVPCIVVDADDVDAEIAMIDENLRRAELSPADRAASTARRKELHEIKHPGTKHGANLEGSGVANFATPEAVRFTADTAVKTGRSERSVQLDAERGEKVSGVALALVAGTDLDKGSYLDKLKKLAPEEQVETVNRALSGLARAAEKAKAETFQKRNQARIDADVKQRASRDVAERIALYLPPDEWDAFKANLAVATVKDILSAFTNITGESVMDRRHG